MAVLPPPSNDDVLQVSRDASKEIVQDLSWAWNYALPDIDITFAVSDLFGNTQKLDWADGLDLIGANHTINWFSQGLTKFSE